MTYRQAVNLALAEEMDRDDKVFILGEDVGAFGGAMAVTKGLYERFGPERVLDTPISEAAIIGAALGAALTGYRPVAEIMFIDFTAVCMDQIVNQVAKVRYMLGGQVKVPLVIRTQGGGGKSYAAQHSQSLEVWFAHTPGLKVVMPSTPASARGLLKAAIRDENPVMFIEHKLLYNETGEVPDRQDEIVPIGAADVVRAGTDITLVSYSRQLLFALEAANILAEDGINCEVIDLQTIAPWDCQAVAQSVRKTGRLVTVEEGNLSFGVGAEIAARVSADAFDFLDAPVERIAARDTPIPFAPVLEAETLPNTEKIVERIKALLSNNEGAQLAQ